MANTNDMNTPTKVPCGGFVLGEGLALSKDGKTLNVTGGGSQADWNQNDETASDYVKNRPFYDASIVTYIVPESTVAFSEDNGKMAAVWPESFDAVEGQTYTISWDGTDYECEPTKLYGATFIGNLAVSGGGADTGEPFLFMYQNQWGVISNDSASEHIISIKIVTPQIVQIDTKYLPTATNDAVGVSKLAVQNIDTNKTYSTEEVGKILQKISDENVIYKLRDRMIVSYVYDSSQSNKKNVTFYFTDNSYCKIYETSDSWSFDNLAVTAGDIIVQSSTAGSTKKFKITVDDSGTISATEVTA